MKRRLGIKFENGDGLDGSREKRTLASRLISVLLLVVPAVGTILFGAVDPATWMLGYAAAALLLMIWFWDTWAGRALTFNASTLLLPLAGLVGIGILQILPLFGPVLPAGT